MFLHILGAISFFIAIAILYTSVLGVRRAQTVQQIKLWTGAAAPAIRLIFPIAGLVLLIAGFYMAAVSWRAAWVAVRSMAGLCDTFGARVKRESCSGSHGRAGRGQRRRP